MIFYIKKILKHSALYGLSNLFVSLTSFILIPLYTMHLAPEEYGAYSIIMLFGTVIFYIYDMGMVSALVRYYFEFDADDVKGKRRIASTVLWFFIFVSIIFSAAFLLGSNKLGALILGQANYAFFIQFMIVIIFLNTVSGVPVTILRVQEKSFLFMCLFALKSIGIIALSYVFLSVLNRGLIGVFESMLLATALFAVLSFAFTFKSYGFSFSLEYLGRMLKFGLPLCPALVFSWIIDFSDRYLVRYFLSLNDVGLYSLGYRFGQVIYMAVLSFLMCWGPILFTIIKEKNAKEIIARLSTYIAAGFMFVTLAISLFGRELVFLMAEGSYYNSYRVIPLISLSYYLFGIYILFFSGIQISKKVYTQPLVLGVASALNILLNIILIPRHGIMGAAAATAATYLFVAAYTYFLAQRSFSIPYELDRLTLVASAGVILFIFSALVPVGRALYTVAVKFFILCLYPIALVVFGIFGRGELERIKLALAKTISRITIKRVPR